MAIRIQLGGTELARVRFAISPVYETVMALDVLRRPGVHAVHLPWARWARPRLAGLPGLDLLLALVSDDQIKPAFMMPPPDARMPDLDAELRRVRATPTVQVRESLELLTHRTGPMQSLYADPRRHLGPLTDSLRRCHELVVLPHWPRMVRLLEADIGHRAGVLAAGGAETLFADLHSEVEWTDGELVVHPHRAPQRPISVVLGGNGLLLCPSVFCWPRVTAGVRTGAAGTLRYPARGVATLWEAREPAPDAVAALIGRNRAALLAALAEPATTGDLARVLDVTPSAVSQHLGVLRAAGLVSTRREGRTVLHLRTDRADTLLS